MQPRIHDFLFDTHYNIGVDNPNIVRFEQPGNINPHPSKQEFLLLSAPTDRFKLLNGGNLLLL